MPSERTWGATTFSASPAFFDRYELPDSFTLAGRETFRLHTGSGESTASDRYWGHDRSAWDSDGGTVTVVDADGSVVLEYPQE